MVLSDLETPAAIVDLDRLSANLDGMATYTKQHALALRPHVKTHKSLHVAAEQVRLGAVGLTCATPREMEVMSGAADDLLLAYPLLGRGKLARVMALPRDVRVTVALDSVEAVMQLADAATDAGREIGVYVEVDVGMHRVGVAGVEEAIALIRQVKSSHALEYRGIAYYPGHIRDAVDQQGEGMARLRADIHRALERLADARCTPAVVSGGSTPTMWRSHEIEGVTE
ncbi:MAG: alanine racemase, partial [Gemmatimonadaceae bacterium]